MEKKIRYTARDFEAVKGELIEFSKKYYPNLTDNWNDSSVGSWLIDIAASVADNLNYHIDRVYQETNINSANSKAAVLNAARLNGVKIPGPKASMCEIQLSCTLPLDSNSGPDWALAPLVKRGSIVGNSTYLFELIEDADFTQQFNENGFSNRTYAPLRNNNGIITAYTVTKSVLVDSGKSKIFKKVITEDEVKPFMEVVIPEKNVMCVESIIFKEVMNYGSEPQSFEYHIDEEEFKISKEDITTYRYFEVDSLVDQYRFGVATEGSTEGSDSIKIYNPVYNKVYVDYTEKGEGVSTRTTRYYKGAWKSITQKFITEYTDNGYLKVIFGGATEECKGENMTSGTANYEYMVANIINNPMMGLLPKAGWTMFVLYRTGGGTETNVGPGAINSIISLNAIFPNCSEDASNKSAVLNSFKVKNVVPSIGGKDAPSVEEIKYLTKYSTGSMGRCVTLKDYKACLMGIHPRYGCPFRCNVVEDNNKISMSVLNLNSNHQLTDMIHSQMVDNIKEYLSHYKMLTDFIEIRSGKIYNLGFGIDVFVDKNYTTADVIAKIINTVSDYMYVDKHDMGEDIFLGDLEKEINNVDGVMGLIDMSVFSITGTRYSQSPCPLPMKNNDNDPCVTSSGFNFTVEGGNSDEIDIDALDHVLYSDVDSQFEIKYPEKDIQVRVKLR